MRVGVGQHTFVQSVFHRIVPWMSLVEEVLLSNTSSTLVVLPTQPQQRCYLRA
jgi:hypothetical protein